MVDSVSVQLVSEGPRAQELVAVNRNRFDPDSGRARHDRRRLLERPMVNVEIYDLSGDACVAWKAGASWTGTGAAEGGVVCGSGVYFLRVEANGGAPRCDVSRSCAGGLVEARGLAVLAVLGTASAALGAERDRATRVSLPESGD